MIQLKFPGLFLSGEGSLQGAALELKRRGWRRPLIVTDPGIVRAGLADRLQEILAEAELEVQRFEEVQPEPRLETVDRAAERVRNARADVVIGLGGGSSMDVAKSAACLSEPGVRCRELLGGPVERRPLPLVLIPTTAGTGSEMNPAAVLIDERENVRKALLGPALSADMVVLDPELTLGLPAGVTADTGMDALVHALEAYVSLRADAFSDALALQAIRAVAGNLLRVLEVPADAVARQQMAVAASLAGSAMGGAGLGAAHALAYPLDLDYRMTHGQTVSVMAPPVLRRNLRAVPAVKLGPLEDALGLPSGDGLDQGARADRIAAWIKERGEKAGLAMRLRDYGVEAEALPELARRAVAATPHLLKDNRVPYPDGPSALPVYEEAY